MYMGVVTAVVSGIAFEQLNDKQLLEDALDQAIKAGNFTNLFVHAHQFQPQGVTAIAVVGESHIALHSWPEEGKLFIDIASCTTLENGKSALTAICEIFHATDIEIKIIEYH